MTAPEPVSESRGRALVHARSGGLCEVGADGAATEVHHRKNRSQGGTWSPDNLLHVCSRHHAWITAYPAGARLKGWALRRAQDPALSPVFLARWGSVLLTTGGGLIETATTTTTSRRAG